MPAALSVSFSAAEQITLALIGVLVILVALIGYRTWQNSRISPEERERQRRARLVSTGKMGDATLTEFQDDLLVYAYVVRGVEYIASQDVSLLRDRVPTDLASVAAILVRYDAKNPANSIVLSEEWTGLRIGDARRHEPEPSA
jgi:hypothetical protein